MIRYFAHHPTAANLMMAAFIILGLAAAPSVKRETFPDIPAKEVEVRVPFPGATAEDVENGICQRIEDAVESVNHLEETRCESREGLAIAVLKMREGNDVSRFLDDVKAEIDAIDDFPDDIETPVVQQLGRTDFVASVAITGPMSDPDLKAYAEQVKDRLLTRPVISQVTVEGFSDHQIRIQVAQLTLRQYGLSVDALADIISRQSVDLPAGSVKARDNEVLIRLKDERRRPLDFRSLVIIGAPSGAEIRLGDIATVTDTFELDESKNLFNGKRAAYLVVEKAKGDDTLDVMDTLQDFLAAERQTAPPGVVYAVTKDISSIVRDRLTMLIRNGIQGLGLVFLTLWLFFSLRFSFWVTLGLPISLLGTIAGMSLIGYSFDMISMVGLLIAVGLIMDDAIVLSENIAAHRATGKSPLNAVVDGARQVAPGVISSFLTTVCVFGALGFMKGDIGAVLRVMPVVLILTLAVSLIEAFFILPKHLSHSLAAPRRESRGSRFRARVEAAIEWLRDAVMGRAIDWCIKLRYLTLGLGLAAVLASIAIPASGLLKFRAFPDLDGDVMEARLLLPQGTPLKKTEAVVAGVVAALDRINAEFSPLQPGGKALIRNIGIQYNQNVDAFESGPHVATVVADLLGSEIRNTKLDTVVKRWRELAGNVPDVINMKFTKTQIGPGGRAIDIRLKGPDLTALKSASLELQAWLNAYQGVVDLSDDLRPGKPEVRVRLREGATMLGLSAQALGAQLRAAFQGKVADEIQVGSESYEVDVRLADADRDSLSDLDDFSVTTPNGTQVPLSAVAYLESGRGYARINRVDGLRTVTLQGDVDTAQANASEIAADTAKRFMPGLLARYPGVSVALEGQAKESKTTGGSIRRNMLIGLLGVFLILGIQFRSYLEPVAVMLAIPLGLVGVIWGHVFMGLDLSMPSIVGFASLAGVVVNDSILLVEFIKIRRRQGQSVADAARHAGRERFRAILLTSLTTIAGVLPLLTERSVQAQVLVPLVTSLAFGLLAATLLLLLVVPAAYTVLDDFGLVSPTRHAHASEAAAV